MDIEIILTSEYKLEKSDVINTAKVINTVFQEKVVGGKGRKIASTSHDGDGHHYTFTITSTNDEGVCDVLANELYNKLDFDFELQIDCDIDEDYLEPCDDSDGVMLIDDEHTVKHSKWVSECVNEGWTFGTDYSKSKKTSPFLKPYHTLSETQKKVLKRSTRKHGEVCVDEDIMAECYKGVK